MSNITTYLDFGYDPINLPNAVASTGNAEAEKIAQFIAQYEPEYLKKILGFTLYELLIANIGDNGTYDALVEGDTFTDTFGNVRKWEGFTVKNNPIACYIYYKYQESNASNTYGVGESVADVENGKRVSPRNKMMTAWNKMVDFNSVLHDYLYAKRTLFPSYIGLNYPPYGYIDKYAPDYINQYQELFIKLSWL